MDRENFISRNVDKIEKTVINGIKLALNNCAEETFNDTDLQAIKDKILKLCQLEEEVQHESDIAQTFPCQGLKTFNKDYKAAKDESKKNNIPSINSARYQRFVQEVDDLRFAHDSQRNNNETQNPTHDLDGPGQGPAAGNLGEFPIFTIDPITKRFLVNPVRNSICQHVYEKDSIEEAIRMNPRLKCPYIACRSTSAVQSRHLIEDRDLKRKLMSMNLGQENQPNESEDSD